MSVPDSPTPADAGALREEARRLLAANDTGSFIKPSLGQYPHQWNWDTAFIAIGLRHLDRVRARDEVRTLLRGQWGDGMVPHILYPDGASDYFPTPEYWQGDGVEGAPPFPTSGLTQPPLLATAVRRLHDDAPDRDASLAFVEEVYAKLLAWHRWLHAARDPDATGLVAIVHPWESGTDNAPRFAPAMEAIVEPTPPPYVRADGAHVRLEERPLPRDYDRYMHLIGLFRSWRWSAEAIYDGSPFLVQDVLFNAITHRAESDLAALARDLGEPTEELDAWREASAAAFESRLWDGASGRYLDLDLRAGRWLTEDSFVTLAPLFGGIPTPERARELVARHLGDPERFAPGEAANGVRTRYLVPTHAKGSERFEPRRYWCGPVWMNVNWLLVQGLRAYGMDDRADAIVRDSLELVRRSGFVEYYDPRDGTPCGSRSFSWSAALTVDLLEVG